MFFEYMDWLSWFRLKIFIVTTWNNHYTLKYSIGTTFIDLKLPISWDYLLNNIWYKKYYF